MNTATDTVVATTGDSCVAGGITNTTAASDGVMTANNDQICSFDAGCFDPPIALFAPKAIAIDGDGSLWVANAANASVSTFGYKPLNFNQTDYFATSTVPYVHDFSNGNTMTVPFGLAIDQSGNVWVSNAGCILDGCTPDAFVLSELIGAAAPTITPLADQNYNQTEGTRPGGSVFPPSPCSPANPMAQAHPACVDLKPTGKSSPPPRTSPR